MLLILERNVKEIPGLFICKYISGKNKNKVETPLLLRKSLKIVALRISPCERDFKISQFQNFKIDPYL